MVFHDFRSTNGNIKVKNGALERVIFWLCGSLRSMAVL